MRKISKVRFEALSYARMPLVKIMSDEIEWYANENNAILGTILHDYTDDDYVAVVLGRDEAGVFRWIDGLAGIESIDEARATLSEKIIEQSREGADEFPQGVITKDKNLIFNPLVREDRMPEDYKTLVNSEFFLQLKN